MSTFVTHFPFYLSHIYPSVDFLSKYLTTSAEEIFFMDTEKALTFFMAKKGIKSIKTITISLWFNYQYFS